MESPLDRLIKMFTKIINGFMSALVITVLSTTAHATPHGKNVQLSSTQLAQLESAYKKHMNTKKAAQKKPAVLKASYSPKSNKANRNYSNRLHVTATAYTSHVGQTDSTPNIAAWGDRLRPGMKVIAVSRDLLKTYGLKHGQKVRIKGLSGEYAVLDKMNKRWRKKIDIYMGMNKRKAFKWGRRKVEILWN